MVATLTKKQQQIQQREREILIVARDIFRERGYLGLNMDRIAQRLGVAKGTVYQHYSCKEEVILGMALETLTRRSAMFEKASFFPGCPRDRMTAIGCAAELFVKWYPDHFELEKVLKCDSIIQKTSGKLQTSRAAAEARCIGLVTGIVRDAIAQGDLGLGGGTCDQLVFGLWSNTFGGYSLIESEHTMEQMGLVDGFRVVRENNLKLLDGYGWRPLSSARDYHDVFDQVERLIFSEGPIPDGFG